MSQPLLQPYRMGSLAMPNRVVMAPLTCHRADNSEWARTALLAEYYARRASAGLIIGEGTHVSPRAVGSLHAPGIYSAEHVAGWRHVTDAVHDAGGRIFAQLLHVGAVSHPDLQPGGGSPVAPSAINPNGRELTASGLASTTTPHALSTAEVAETVAEFRRAAGCAMEAGFDGVEIHAADGYLFSQFFARSMNRRTDRYGGSIVNRSRFLSEVVEAVSYEVPLDRVGICLSPAFHGRCGILFDRESYPLFRRVIAELSAYQLAYLHLVESKHPTPDPGVPPGSVASHFRPFYAGTLISAGGHSHDSGNRAITLGMADLIAYGRAFIANPDLVDHFAATAQTGESDGGAAGSSDHPRASDEATRPSS